MGSDISTSKTYFSLKISGEQSKFVFFLNPFFIYNTHTNITYYILENPFPFPPPQPFLPFAQDRDEQIVSIQKYRAFFYHERDSYSNDLMYWSLC